MNALDVVKAAKATGGFYKGKPASPDSVKFTRDFQGLKIKVDRPKGFIMIGTDSKGNEWKRKYQVDYGFIPKTLGGDNDGLDVFIGPEATSRKAFWAIQRDDEGNFDEYKIFLGFNNREEASATYLAHIPRKYFGRMVTTTVEMMKAMLGTNPEEVMAGTKTASDVWSAFVEAMSTKLADTTEFVERGEVDPGYGPPVRPPPRLPPLTSLDHPGNKYLKQNLIAALIQGTVGAGSTP